ncbi:MAG: hypothetical protein D6724_06740 [Armatimonadetes bacterium]|nr:MAG: hypothetical protein D6724_06740 [Armatimonadota bacterium]
MLCRDCHRYDAEEGVCRDGKLNPESFADAVEVAQVFGPRAICVFNDYRERVLDIRKGAAMRRPPERHVRPRRWWRNLELD